MATEVHEVIKPEVLIQTALAAIELKLVTPSVFQREGIDQFKGAKDDTINVPVEGVLPFRTYGWRNDRSAPIQFDEYSERKVAVTFGDDIYSGVRLTDEQRDFDLQGWGKLVAKQGEAIARGLNRKAVAALREAPYEITVTIDEKDTFGGLVRLKAIFDRLGLGGARTLHLGPEFESALVLDERTNLASNAGDRLAESAIEESTVGKRSGFTIVSATELDGDEGYAHFESGFIFLTGAPSVPQGVPFGASASADGIALTWLMDYDTEYRRDRSVLNAYQGFNYVTDPLIGVDAQTEQAYVSEDNHFVRGVKVKLGDAYSVEIDGGDDNELVAITGIKPVGEDSSDSGSSSN